MPCGDDISTLSRAKARPTLRVDVLVSLVSCQVHQDRPARWFELLEKTSLIVGYMGLRDLEVNCCDEAGLGSYSSQAR